jgi:hypothetical protein
MSAVLTTRLKITDLTAETALETGRKLLPEGISLERLVREELYLFEPAPGQVATAFEAPLERAIESSNFFVNPNKERYRFLRAAARGDSLVPPEGAWGILARPRDDTRDDVLLDRLLREHPLPGLGAIRRARIWWLWTKGPRGDTAIETSHAALGAVEGARKGLLTNPHAEASLLVAAPIPWARVEEFLSRDSAVPSRAS